MTITVDDMVRREIVCCVSTLISDLLIILPNVPHNVLKNTSLDYDELLNLTGTNDWEEPVDRYIDDMDREDLIEALEEFGVDDDRHPSDKAEAAIKVFADLLVAGEVDPMDGDTWEDQADKWPGMHDADLREKLLDHLKEEDELQEFAEEHRIEPDFQEVLEHWAVTDWLAARLKEKGEAVEDVANLTVWGRRTSGQMISMDGVIQEIHRDLVSS